MIGNSQDLTLVFLRWLAQRKGIEVIELEEEMLGKSWSFSFDDQQIWEGEIITEKGNFRLSEMSGAYVRLSHQPSVLPELNLTPEEEATLIVERRAAIQYFLNFLPFTVANRPCSGRSNASKPYQMQLLTNAGFIVPKWILTNQIESINTFARKYNHGVIYKSCSGLRSRVKILDGEVLQKLKDSTSPIIIQEYIKGSDVRIHTIDQHAFATEIDSSGIDYRFHDQPAEMKPISVPDRIKELCFRFANNEGLTIAGFDFRVTLENYWYCLEANPVPSFLPYEMETGQPIGNTLLNALTKRQSD